MIRRGWVGMGQVAPGAPKSGVGYATADENASGISQASNKQDSVTDSSFALATGVWVCVFAWAVLAPTGFCL